MPYILDNHWFIDGFILLVKIGRLDKALVNFPNLVELSLILVYIVYIGYLFLLSISVLALEDKIYMNIR